MESEERIAALQQLVERIKQRRLSSPASFVVDIIHPVAFMASQCALLIRPFTPLGRWHDYVNALSDEEGWALLHDLLDRRDC